MWAYSAGALTGPSGFHHHPGQDPIRPAWWPATWPPRIGYPKVSRFSATTMKESQAALAELRRSGMRTLIPDLQSNGGGYLARPWRWRTSSWGTAADRVYRRTVLTEGITPTPRLRADLSRAGWSCRCDGGFRIGLRDVAGAVAGLGPRRGDRSPIPSARVSCSVP